MKPILFFEFILYTSLISLILSEQAWQRIDKSEVNCNFNEGEQPFCEWKPASVDSADLWKTGNAVIMDSVNSITKSADGDDHFAYVQGEYGAPSKGSLESPEIFPGKQKKVFKFAYWKTASTPILDVCVKDSSGYNIDCIDSISGPDQKTQQWNRKSVTLPKMQTSYKIVLRARSIHSAEDIIGVDDLQLMDALETEQVIAQQQQSSKRYPSLMAASQRHFSPIEEPSTEFPLIDSERQKAEPPIETKHVENPLMPLKMNKFGMSPSLSSAIMPTKPETLFPPLPNFTAPVPAAFPDFPSFPQGFLPGTLPATNNKLEKQEMCRAIKCSFLDGTCEWTLGPTWKRSDGNIAMEIGGEDTVISAAFKAPLGSYIEFDLWMSDDSFFTVMEVMDSMDFILFTRQGMSNNGWHRFRIPLRPSFTPVQIKFKNALPPGGFITLSNTRLVNGNGEEVSCETVYGGIVTMPPLFPPPSSMSLQNLMAPAPPIQMPSMLKLRDNIGGGASAFGGNIFEGVKPIKPMKDDPQRLTAFQGYTPQMLLSTTPEPFLLPTFQKSEFPIIDATTKNQALSGFGLPFSQFQQPKPVGIVSATSNSKGGGGDLLSQLGAHPSVEKELRQLASRFGFDTNKIPDPTTLNMLKRFLGPKMPLNFGTKIAEFNSNGNNNGISQNLRPIKPVNVDSEDFERVYKEESLKRMFAPPTSAELSKASSSLNGELLKSFASVIQLPSNSPDPQLPFRQKNLDFAYQNALSSPSKKY